MSGANVDDQLRVLRRHHRLHHRRRERDKNNLAGRSLKLRLDPADIHLGSAVVLRKLRRFGTSVTSPCSIIGDFTAGSATRGEGPLTTALSGDEIDAHDTYVERAQRICSGQGPPRVRYNSEWLRRWTWPMCSKLPSRHCKRLERNDSPLRGRRADLDDGAAVPAPQGWDSVMIDADVELGGAISCSTS
jgi:tyrosyl-tRNA synthetase